MARPLHEIASEIRSDWRNPNFAAKPYLEAMESLNSVCDTYFADSGKSVVSYFLVNAGTWRGDVAKKVKAELKTALKDRCVPGAKPAPPRPDLGKAFP